MASTHLPKALASTSPARYTPSPNGPFAETKELIAGFMILRVNSLQEAIGWVKRMPNCSPGGEGEVEIRQIFEPEDFAPNFSEEEIQQEKQIRGQLADHAAKK